MLPIYDEPTARKHIAVSFAPSPDKQRPDFVDRRIVICHCGMVVVLGGQVKNKPKSLAKCEVCYAIS